MTNDQHPTTTLWYASVTVAIALLVAAVLTALARTAINLELPSVKTDIGQEVGR
jgi:hypothetical protein